MPETDFRKKKSKKDKAWDKPKNPDSDLENKFKRKDFGKDGDSGDRHTFGNIDFSVRKPIQRHYEKKFKANPKKAKEYGRKSATKVVKKQLKRKHKEFKKSLHPKHDFGKGGNSGDSHTFEGSDDFPVRAHMRGGKAVIRHEKSRAKKIQKLEAREKKWEAKEGWKELDEKLTKGEKVPRRCYYCGKRFLTNKAIEKHMLDAHSPGLRHFSRRPENALRQ